MRRDGPSQSSLDLSVLHQINPADLLDLEPFLGQGSKPTETYLGSGSFSIVEYKLQLSSFGLAPYKLMF